MVIICSRGNWWSIMFRDVWRETRGADGVRWITGSRDSESIVNATLGSSGYTVLSIPHPDPGTTQVLQACGETERERERDFLTWRHGFHHSSKFGPFQISCGGQGHLLVARFLWPSSRNAHRHPSPVWRMRIRRIEILCGDFWGTSSFFLQHK